jgi:hypothetical protein
MDLNLDREDSPLNLPSHPNEVKLIIDGAPALFLHIGDTDLKTLYYHVLDTSGSALVRNQYADTFVLQCIIRRQDDKLVETQLVLRAKKVIALIHYGKAIFSHSHIRRVGLIVRDTHVFYLSFQNYEILRRDFIPDNPDQAIAFPAWNAKRIVPEKGGREIKVKNQWAKAIAIDGYSIANGTLRKSRFVSKKDDLIGYLDFNKN